MKFSGGFLAVKKIRDFLGRAEEIVEDLILILLSVFVIILAVSALIVLASAPPSLTERELVISSITQLGFLAKAEYFAALLLPWVAMIIGLLVARELWLVRRAIQGVHLETVLRRLGEKKKR